MYVHIYSEWTAWSHCSHSCGEQGRMSRWRMITGQSSQEVHQETLSCNRHQCPHPLSSFTSDGWSRWLPGCPNGLQTHQKVWRQQIVRIPADDYNKKGKADVVSVKGLPKNIKETFVIHLFSTSLTRWSRKESVQSAVIPVHGSAVQNVVNIAVMSQGISSVPDSSTLRKSPVLEKVCSLARTSQIRCLALFQRTVHGRATAHRCLTRSNNFRLLIAIGL